MIPLFKYYPGLEEKIPFISLGRFPTPLHRMEKLGDFLGIPRLYIKRDDLSGETYGGNKVRKLEFLLAEALKSGAKEVITVGMAGSNHSLATTIYSKKVGLEPTSLLLPQPNAGYVRENLLMTLKSGGNPIHCLNTSSMKMRVATMFANNLIGLAKMPYFIPPGGSSPTGVLGFVNAGLEFADQVKAGKIPEPDYIYTAMGTMGTVTGLLIGLKLAGLKTKVRAVRVVDREYANAKEMKKLFRKTRTLLRVADPDFPRLRFSGAKVEIYDDFFGIEYALYTGESVNAVRTLKQYEGIKIDGTYTGKAMAALLADAAEGKLRNKAVVFWNTKNSVDISKEVSDVDYRELPQRFHRYFEEDVQPLDLLI